MKPRCEFGLLASVLALTVVASAPADEWGNLKGRFLYDGRAQAVDEKTQPKEVLLVDRDGGLANVVVCLRTEGIAVHPDYQTDEPEPAVLDIKDGRFQPHIVVMRIAQPLLVKNSDPAPDNAKIDSADGPANYLIAPGASVKHSFPKRDAIPVPVSSSLHIWMRSYVILRDDPYATVSDAKGSFEIKNLPAGTELEFQLWHEQSGWLRSARTKLGNADARGRIKITLKPGDNDLGDVKLNPTLFAN